MCLVVPLVSSDAVFDRDHFVISTCPSFRVALEDHSPAYCFTSYCLTKEADNDVLALSSSLHTQNQQIKGVTERQTNQSDLDRWAEVPFRLGRERSCCQDVCETGVCALRAGAFARERVSGRRHHDDVSQIK